MQLRLAQLLILFFVLFASCKSYRKDTLENNPSTQLLILLRDNVLPSQIQDLKSMDPKRVSRTQNLWMVTSPSIERAHELKMELLNDDRIKEIKIAQSENDLGTSKNNKSGKATPSNN